jgi:hypothetical protein
MENRSGIYYVTPAQVFEDERLEHSEILFYALLSGLAYSNGYCFASDKYLAERMRSKERTIQDWLSRLEGFGYIRRDTKKIGMGWDRKIFICHSRLESNNSYEGNSSAVSNGIKIISTKGTPVPYREAPQCHIEREEEEKEKIVCSPPPVGGTSEPRMIKKKHPKGHEVEISLDDIFRSSISKKKNWTTKEIYDAWKILVEYQGLVRVPMGYFDGTIKNMRTQAKGKAYGNKTQKNQEQEICKQQESESSENCSEKQSGRVMWEQLFPNWRDEKKTFGG